MFADKCFSSSILVFQQGSPIHERYSVSMEICFAVEIREKGSNI